MCKGKFGGVEDIRSQKVFTYGVRWWDHNWTLLHLHWGGLSPTLWAVIGLYHTGLGYASLPKAE